MNHTYTSMNEAYFDICRRFTSTLLPTISPRGQETIEMIGQSFTLIDPLKNVVCSPARAINPSFMAAELVWMLLGSNDARLITPYNKNIGQFSDDGITFRGAYGPKLVEQLPYVLDTLRKDPYSRQAVLTIWRERPGPSVDIPCTVSMQFFIRDSKLEMVVYMRSNDVWLGLPYDVFNFTGIQQYLAAALEVAPGPYHHHVGSLHLYKKHWAVAEGVVHESAYTVPEISQLQLTYPMPPQFMAMAVGLSALGETRSSGAELAAWLDAGSWGINRMWADLLNLMAYRFHKESSRLSPQYERLVT